MARRLRLTTGSPLAPAARLIATLLLIAATPALATEVHGHVSTAQGPLADAAVTLWAAGAGEPARLAQVQSGADGNFVLNADANGAVLYVIAKGGHPAGKAAGPSGLALLAVLGETLPERLVINELTTVASAFTAVQFIHGETISGNPLGCISPPATSRTS